MNHKQGKDFRSDLAKAKGLGSARTGYSIWWAQRVTAVALLPLVMWFAWFVIEISEYGNIQNVTAVFTSPFTAIFLTLFIAVGLYHGCLGMKEIIEDYVHCPYFKVALILFVQFFTALTAVAGICAILAFHFSIFEYN